MIYLVVVKGKYIYNISKVKFEIFVNDRDFGIGLVIFSDFVVVGL